MCKLHLIPPPFTGLWPGVCYMDWIYWLSTESHARLMQGRCQVERNSGFAARTTQPKACQPVEWVEPASLSCPALDVELERISGHSTPLDILRLKSSPGRGELSAADALLLSKRTKSLFGRLSFNRYLWSVVDVWWLAVNHVDVQTQRPRQPPFGRFPETLPHPNSSGQLINHQPTASTVPSN